MPITREEVILEIQKLASADGVIPGERGFANATRIKESAWKGKYWPRWTDAIREAGYDPNTLNQRIPDEEILHKLAAFITNLGHFPIREEINVQARTVSGFPVWQTIRKRYGGMPETAAALLEHGRKTDNEKLARLCEERIKKESSKPVAAAPGQSKTKAQLGFVYLKYSPSLRLYKIGKADNHVKRGAGLSLLLPEDLVSKHEIKTDCPFILEKYWQSRFRTKKKQGEWFDLNSRDI